MRQSPTQTVLFVSGLLTLWQFADPRGAEGLLAIHGVSRGELPFQPWRFLTTALLHGGILHFVFNAMWAIRLGLPFESRYGNRASAIFVIGVTPLTVLFTVLAGNATIGLSGWGFALGGWIFVARKFDTNLQQMVSDETMGTLVVWFGLGFVLSWLRVLPIDNVAHTAGAVLGAGGALCVYRDEWRRARSRGHRRRKWQRALRTETKSKPDDLFVALRQQDLALAQRAFENPELVVQTPVDLWDQWTEALLSADDESNAKRTLAVAIAIGGEANSQIRLMRLANLEFRTGEPELARKTLNRVNPARLRPDERSLYKSLQDRFQ